VTLTDTIKDVIKVHNLYRFIIYQNFIWFLEFGEALFAVGEALPPAVLPQRALA